MRENRSVMATFIEVNLFSPCSLNFELWFAFRLCLCLHFRKFVGGCCRETCHCIWFLWFNIITTLWRSIFYIRGE